MTFEERLTGRLSKQQVLALAHELRHDEEGIDTLCSMMIEQQVAHTAMNAAWVLTHVSEESKQVYLEKWRDQIIDFAMSANIKIRRGLPITILLDMPDAPTPRADFLDYCLVEFHNPHQHDSCRSCMIKMTARLCAPYPELRDELRRHLEMLHTPIPSIASAKRHVLKQLDLRKP